MTNIPYIRLWTYQGSDFEDTLRRACGIATNPAEFLAAYAQVTTKES